MATLVVEEAARSGFDGLASSLESALAAFLHGLSRDDQRRALRLSYELAQGGGEPALPRLRLVHSRA
jgi:hypothetical protein